MKDVYYFPHDYNARNDEKAMALRARTGLAGYGLYWCLIEILHEHSGKLDTKLFDGLSYDLRVTTEELTKTINLCIELGLFQKKGNYIYCKRVKNNLIKLNENRKKKSEAGKKGMLSRWRDNNVITNDNTVITKHNKGKERKGKERKINNINISKRLPTIDDLKEIDVKGIAEQYQVTEAFVLGCWDNVMNYCHSHDKRYKNWTATLKNFVKRDAEKEKKHGRRISVIPVR